MSYRALVRCKSISAMRSSRHEHRELNPREGLTGRFSEGGSLSWGVQGAEPPDKGGGLREAGSPPEGGQSPPFQAARYSSPSSFRDCQNPPLLFIIPYILNSALKYRTNLVGSAHVLNSEKRFINRTVRSFKRHVNKRRQKVRFRGTQYHCSRSESGVPAQGRRPVYSAPPLRRDIRR